LVATVGVAIIGIGVARQFATDQDLNPNGWFVVGGFVVLAAVLGYVWYFLWMPHVHRMSQRRASVNAREDRVVRAQGARPKNLEIIHANYGAHGTFQDVTTRVRSLVTDNSLTFSVTNDVLGAGDPKPGSLKELIIQYRYGDQEHSKTFTEGSSATLP
jgi:hypothetical protein